MKEMYDSSGDLLEDEQRMTEFGTWLRSSSLDELPEICNILKGDMSFVGPRPLLMEYMNHYSKEQHRRHTVKPGLTGLAQVNGRNNISWENKFDYDLAYIREKSFYLDLKILLKTILRVWKREGISTEGNVTSAKFSSKLPIVIVGAGGQGKIALACLQSMGERIEAIYDDDKSKWGRRISGIPIVGPISKLEGEKRFRCFVAIGSNHKRAVIVRALNHSVDWVSLVHKSAIVHESVVLGEGSIICAGAIVQPYCTIGNHVIVNTAAKIDHDCKIGDFSQIGPSAVLTGSVQIAEFVTLGAGSVILPEKEIGEASTVGAGSVVTRNVDLGTTVIGVPAKKHLKEQKEPSNGWPNFNKEQLKVVEKVLKSGKVNYWTGNEGKKFEQEYAEYLGVKYAVAVSNGTVALELALEALDISQGDEVIVPSRTFVATASAVLRRGGIPVFADIDEQSQNITVKSIKKALTSKTRAIIVVHLGGWPCDMEVIMAIAKEYKLFVIEDCAQAHGASYKGQPVGSFGHINTFSFCQDKIITTGGEGGMVVTNSKSLCRLARSIKDHGKSWDAVHKMPTTGSFRYLHESVGTNFRMTEMQAAIGRVQLRELNASVRCRRQNADLYRQLLSDCPGLYIPRPSKNVVHAYYRLYGLVDESCLKPGWSRDRIVAEMIVRGLSLGSGSCAEVYREKVFNNLRNSLVPNATVAQATSLAFLVDPSLSPEDIQNISGELNLIMRKIVISKSVIESKKQAA